MRTLLLDADIIAYKVACLNEELYQWGPEGADPAVAVDHAGAKKLADEIIEDYCEELKTNDVIICLTDSVNFRKELNPTYKENRAAHRRPELLAFVKEYLKQYRTYQRPRLEADDVMGILATHPRWIRGEKIMVSEDKDMRTVPGLVWNPRHPDLGILEISELDADRFHMWQTLCGDQVDGYPGCPGIGPVYAEEILGLDRDELWDFVLFAYCSKGLTEDDAILQARMARILRASDWNNREKKVRLWQPWFLDEKSTT